MERINKIISCFKDWWNNKSIIVIEKIKENSLYSFYQVKNIGNRTATNIQFRIETTNNISIDKETMNYLPIESLSPHNEPFVLKIYTGEKGKAILKYNWKECLIFCRKDSVVLII